MYKTGVKEDTCKVYSTNFNVSQCYTITQRFSMCINRKIICIDGFEQQT